MEKIMLYTLALVFLIFLINASSPISMCAAISGLLFCVITLNEENKNKNK